jgi:hypothetical protein
MILSEISATFSNFCAWGAAREKRTQAIMAFHHRRRLGLAGDVWLDPRYYAAADAIRLEYDLRETQNVRIRSHEKIG